MYLLYKLKCTKLNITLKNRWKAIVTERESAKKKTSSTNIAITIYVQLFHNLYDRPGRINMDDSSDCFTIALTDSHETKANYTLRNSKMNKEGLHTIRNKAYSSSFIKLS